jgi:hypothetical protein
MRSVRSLVLILALSLVVPAVARADPYEPNDNIAQARGPLVGGMDYTGGAIDTDNDEDWFTFVVGRQAQIDITWTVVQDPIGTCPLMWFLTSEGGFINSGDSVVGCPGSGHLLHTVPGPAKYFLQIFGHQGGTYSFRVDPADALIGSLPTTGDGNAGDQTNPINPPTLPKPFGAGGVFVVPSNHRCVSRRHFRIRIRRQRNRVTLISAAVAVNGRRVAVRRGGRLTAPVDLRGLPKGRFTVRISALTDDGRAIVGTRRYRTCTPKRPPNPPGPV